MKKYFLILSLLVSSSVFAEQVIQAPEDFVAQAFTSTTPKAKTLWLNKEQKAEIADILQHNYNRLRIRYWPQGERSAWILEEIGKEAPITVGLVVEKQQLKQIKVLIYRESRGDEVKADFFTKQFVDAKLIDNKQLDKQIDGITGATLSVRALTKLARMALWLDQERLAH
ncbi:FMN-binding protein [Thalassomonas sp. M1454]|uniref:FMN-binding protein n=1 Tax=Thalassomonas sp. M1454 TaxID=2594477 RepID=UPI00117E0E03|nr:FMN-binding protein [Thalassomonas sp. M1454]TRX58055.1 FMN-binding protein [Thalassomonas sp. M1454]